MTRRAFRTSRLVLAAGSALSVVGVVVLAAALTRRPARSVIPVIDIDYVNALPYVHASGVMDPSTR
ncbi:hypothetical protein [Frigoribacterium sp. MCBA15_019]|uniref:hypothetical protein n=1 Tax=Frigoribacterium sp. MCBA15_019 TaxID=1898745 RepID=UPI00115FB368|nr:hypothetical protein [Frigoribacterium sp. MCBA15_019]